MSIYYCAICGFYKNDDYDPCNEYPNHPTECICPECAETLKDDTTGESDV